MIPSKQYYRETEIALHLLPYVIARQIRKIGDKICRISVKRTHWHHYNVTVRTKTVRKELGPEEVPVLPAGTGKCSRRNRRGCSA